jgi:hypothetical protein
MGIRSYIQQPIDSTVWYGSNVNKNRDFIDIVRSGLTLYLDAANESSYFGYWSPTLSNGNNAFDGSLSTAAGGLGGSFGPYTYTFAKPQSTSSARMYVAFGASSGQVGSRTNVFLVNGIDVTQKAKNANVFTDGVGPAWIDVTTEAAGSWTTFQFTGTSGSTNPGIYAIEVNGQIIIGNYGGTTWIDLSGNGSNATLYNSPTWSSTNGGTFTFNGSNQYAAPAAGFANFTSGITVFSIVNFGSASTWERIVDFGVGQANNNFIFARNSTTNNLTWVTFNGTTERPYVTYTSGIQNNTIACYAATHSNTNVNIYRNGILGLGPVSYPYTLDNVTRNNCYIGRSNWADAYFETTMNVIMIYNRALSAAEIQQNFNVFRGRYGL